MTRDEYEAQLRRLDDDIKAAYDTFNRARDRWDGLCEERLALSYAWRQQHRDPQ